MGYWNWLFREVKGIIATISSSGAFIEYFVGATIFCISLGFLLVFPHLKYLLSTIIGFLLSTHGLYRNRG